MAERTARGSRMVSFSMETSQNVVPSDRQSTSALNTASNCPSPPRQRSSTLSAAAVRRRCSMGPPTRKPVKLPRTHWDMLSSAGPSRAENSRPAPAARLREKAPKKRSA